MCPFKEGDMISPKKERIQTNFFKLTNLISAKVIKVHYPDTAKSYLTVEIVEGNTYSGYDGLKIANSRIGVYSDAFELASPPEPKYQVW